MAAMTERVRLERIEDRAWVSLCLFLEKAGVSTVSRSEVDRLLNDWGDSKIEMAREEWNRRMNEALHDAIS